MGCPTNARPCFQTLWLHPEKISSFLPATCRGRQCRLCQSCIPGDRVQSTSWKVWRSLNSIQCIATTPHTDEVPHRLNLQQSWLCWHRHGQSCTSADNRWFGSSSRDKPIQSAHVISWPHDPRNREPFTPRLCGPGQQNQLGINITRNCDPQQSV